MLREANGKLIWQAEGDYPSYCIGRIEYLKTVNGVKATLYVDTNNVHCINNEDTLNLALHYDYGMTEAIWNNKETISPLCVLRAANNVVKAYFGKDELDAFEHYKMYTMLYDKNLFYVDMVFMCASLAESDDNIKDRCYVIVTPRE